MPKIIPIRDLKNTSEISKLCEESAEPIYITRNGYGEMVLMSMKVYEESVFKASVYEKLEKSENQYKNGEVLDARGELQRMRAGHHVEI
jgi:PHD/YefM family antitoxin component YafN of YafNO toxin-antitoxin module